MTETNDSGSPKIGLSLGLVNPTLWLDLAVAADELGYDSVWLPEHLVLPVVASGSPLAGDDHPPVPPHISVPDVMVNLGLIAGRTKRIGLGTNVYNIGLRHPFTTARAIATIDIVSEGRMEFGIGSSWLAEEWTAAGLDFTTRGRRVDEAIQVCQKLWSEDVIEHHGEFFDFDEVMFNPKPPSEPIRLHIGGDGRAALRRVAEYQADWIPMNHELEEIPAALETIAELSQKFGHNRQPVVTVAGAIDSDEDMSKFEANGIGRVLVSPWTSTKNALDGVAKFAERFLD